MSERAFSGERRVEFLEKKIQQAEEGGRLLEADLLEHLLVSEMLGIDIEYPTSSQESLGFEYFVDSAEREDIVTFTVGTVEFIRENKIRSIIFLDRSARPAWVAFNEYFNLKYPNEQKPGFYFLNPEPFRNEADQNLLNGFLNRLSSNSTRNSFRSSHKSLFSKRSEPLLIFDTCSHTGYTVNSVKEVLEKIGFSEVHIITASRPDVDSGVESEVLFDDKANYQLCYPFGHDHLVEKTNSVISKRNNSPEALSFATTIRSELKKIIQDSFKEEK